MPAPLPGHADGCTCDGCMIAFGCLALVDDALVTLREENAELRRQVEALELLMTEWIAAAKQERSS